MVEYYTLLILAYCLPGMGDNSHMVNVPFKGDLCWLYPTKYMLKLSEFQLKSRFYFKENDHQMS